MAITTKQRFEILKRDGFACQYCGRKAPDVKLHVDHIVPVSAGGTDDEGNLATACQDCNLGKWAHTLPGLDRVGSASGDPIVRLSLALAEALDLLVPTLPALEEAGLQWKIFECLHVFAELAVLPSGHPGHRILDTYRRGGRE